MANKIFKKEMVVLLFLIVIILSSFIANSENAEDTVETIEEMAEDIINEEPATDTEEINEIETTEETVQTEEIVETINEEPPEDETIETIEENSSDTLLINLEEITPIKNNESEPRTEIIEDKSNIANESLFNKSNMIEENNTEYINLDIIISNTNSGGGTKETNESLENTSKNKTEETVDVIKKTEEKKIILYKNGKKELEAEISPDIIIKKQEVIKENGNKEVNISSNNHVDTALVVYTDIPEIHESEKGSIKIYWVNEDREITIKDFIDEDGNGLFERISWIVPHLSEQIFEIIIDLNVGGTSSNIEIMINDAPTGEESNPIAFDFEINYSSLEDVECLLTIDVDSTGYKNINQTIEWLTTLPNGPHTWLLLCKDTINPSIENSVFDNFTINEEFSVNLNSFVYLLNNNETITLNISSKNPAHAKIKLTRPNGVTLTLSDSISLPQTYTIPRTEITQTGVYSLNVIFDNLAQPYSVMKNFTIINPEITTNKDNIEAGQSIIVYVNITSYDKNITSVILNFGDGANNFDYFDINQISFNSNFGHTYNQEGAHILTLNQTIDGKRFTIQKNSIHVNSSDFIDTTPPEINLIQPGNDVIIYENRITFLYEAEDNVKINNCTFELYNYSKGFGTLDYSVTHTNIEPNVEKEVKLTNFKEGDYSWNVFCCDNSSNCNGDLDYDRDFTISFSNSSEKDTPKNDTHEKTQEIKDLLSDIETFLTKKESYTLEEKEVLEELKISEDLEYYKKRLAQIDRDLGHNIKFIDDLVLREQRKQEMLDELEEIKAKVPKELRIINTHEYIKNSIAQNMEDITIDYIEFKKTQIDNRGIKKLAELNYKIQSQMTVSTNVRQVEITYDTTQRRITQVTKKIQMRNNSFDKILEVIPKDIADNASKVIFITESEVIKQDPIFELLLSNLENDRLIYYIEEFIDVKEIEKTETVLFKEFSTQGFGITGFFALDFIRITDSFSYIIILAFVIVIAYLTITFTKKLKITKWKEEENVVKIFDLIRENKRNIRRNDLNTARETYHKIQELYPLIPEKCKKYLYKEIRKIRIFIDKKDIFNLVREHREAKRQGRKEDAAMVYKNIQATYKRLPKKYQTVIYEKMFKPPNEFY